MESGLICTKKAQIDAPLSYAGTSLFRFWGFKSSYFILSPYQGIP